MPRNIQPSTAPSGAVYLTAAQLRTRYGGVSHMWIERKLQNDASFPKPVTFGDGSFASGDWTRSRPTSG